ncbi:hypothetical protein ACWZQY_026375 [Priestia megaterium]
MFQKYRESRACVVTREITDQNEVYIDDIVLSSKGKEILLKELAMKGMENYPNISN